MTEAVKPPHQPADHREDFCRVCCLPADEANETCIPYPGNPRRPFLSPQTTFAFFDKNHPLHAGPPICSAPPDDDPVLNHILVFINEFTGAGGCGCGKYPGADWIEEAARLAAETGATISCGCDDCMAARYDSGRNTPAGSRDDTPTGARTNA